MKERPILFSAPMVRAILEGRKTQTRRIVKKPARSPHLVLLDYGKGWRPFESEDGESAVMADGCEHPLACPHGQPGDRLWVRETWAAIYAFDHLPPRLIPQDANIHYAATKDRGGLLWRPSIHMPRWASRITLAVTDVRVERLQQISEADAIADGLMPWRGGYLYSLKEQWFKSPVDAFKQKWEAANKDAASWVANPWVWVIEFKRLEGQQ